MLARTWVMMTIGRQALYSFNRETANLNELAEQWYKKIWLTRKARINAAERMLWSESALRFFITYYSGFIIIMTVIGKESGRSGAYLEILALSIVVFGASLYAPALRLSERAERLKKNYIALDRVALEMRIVAWTPNPSAKDVQNVADKYLDLMAQAENHAGVDYTRARMSGEEKLNLADRISFLTVRVIEVCIPLVVALVPPVLALRLISR